jgi:hypothetical protein
MTSVRTRLDSGPSRLGMRKLWCAPAARMGYAVVGVVIGFGAAVAILIHNGSADGATQPDSIRPANAIAIATGSQQASPSVLYVQMARRGSLSRADRRGRATLTLKGVSRATLFFSDRPERFAGQTATRRLVASWRRTFGSDPPNAALRVLRRGTGRDLAVELLGRPSYNARTATLSYRIRRLYDPDAGEFPRRFKSASLFIDSAPDSGYIVKATWPDGSSARLLLGTLHFLDVIARQDDQGELTLDVETVTAVPPDQHFWFTNFSGQQIVATVSREAQPDVPFVSAPLDDGTTTRITPPADQP